ncbi:hypothetical protein KL929_000710 [Ogataea haglerorum]|nr:hypothetical protein KL929_000710 [Ogataea haglerorum]
MVAFTFSLQDAPNKRGIYSPLQPHVKASLKLHFQNPVRVQTIKASFKGRMATSIVERTYSYTDVVNMDGTHTLRKEPDSQTLEAFHPLFCYTKTVSGNIEYPATLEKDSVLELLLEFQFPVDRQLLPSSCSAHGEQAVGKGSISTQYEIDVAIVRPDADPITASFPISFQADSDPTSGHVSKIRSEASHIFPGCARRLVQWGGAVVQSPFVTMPWYSLRLRRLLRLHRRDPQLAADVLLSAQLSTVSHLGFGTSIQSLGELVLRTPQTHDYTIGGLSTGVGEFCVLNVKAVVLSQMQLRIGQAVAENAGTPVELFNFDYKPGTEPRFDVAEFEEHDGMLSGRLPLSKLLPDVSLLDVLEEPFMPNIQIGSCFKNTTRLMFSLTLCNNGILKKRTHELRFYHDIVLGPIDKPAPDYSLIEHTPAPAYTLPQQSCDLVLLTAEESNSLAPPVYCR